MKKTEIQGIIRSAIKSKDLCRMYFKYDGNYHYYFPLCLSDKLFLGAKEDDFLLDGFCIRRFCDLKKVEIKNDMSCDITKKETKINELPIPKIDVSDWQSVFSSLQKTGQNIIIEHESLDDANWEFYIGHIEKVLKTKVLFKHFDADGIWQEELYNIPYSQITSVSFGCRYVEVFSKYV